MKSKGVVAASIRSSRGPAGGGSCALLVANTSTCRQFRRGHLACSCSLRSCPREVITVRPVQRAIPSAGNSAHLMRLGAGSSYDGRRRRFQHP
jgi:hypothetical protein